MSSWLIHSPIITYHGNGWVTSDLNKKLKLQPGDVVWIGKQRDKPEVKAFVYSFPAGSHETYLREDRRHLAGRDFVWLSWLGRVVGRQ